MVEENQCATYGVDQHLSASIKKILLQKIVFKEAQVPDEGDILNHKYKPINGSFGAHQIKLLKSNTSKDLVAQSDVSRPNHVVFPLEKVELEWKNMRRIGPGLANLGNTCFLNSVLQVLAYTPPLVNYILSNYHKEKCQVVGFCMQCELTNHVTKIVHHNNQNGAVRPISIIQKLQYIGKNFRFGRQEDAHEFLRYVVEAVQKSDYAGRPKLDKLSKETSVANAIFGGYYRSQVKCLHCHHESNTFDPIMDLNLDIKDVSSITQALHRSIRPDRLDGDNKYFCEKCRTKRIAQKRGTIHREPNVLTLQLKRFDYNRTFGGKICKDVSFSEELNIRPFMSNSQGDPMIYKLYSVLVHSGISCNSGHYYSYVKAPNGTWYEMNDNRVCQVGLQTVLHAQAYILFYLRKHKKKVPNVQSPGRKCTVVKENLSCSVTQSIVNKGGMQKVDLNHRSLSEADIHQISNDLIHSSGVHVKRKSEPKINWSFNTVKDNLSGKSSNHNLNVSTGAVVIDNSLNVAPKIKVKDEINVACHREQPKGSEKSANLNGLQALSRSYMDSDCTSSGTPSPTPIGTQRNITNDNVTINKIQANDSLPVIDHRDNLGDQADPRELVVDEVTKSSDVKPPFKLTLKNGKQFIHKKLNIWSPLTKGKFYPRVITNRCLSENDGDQLKSISAIKKRKSTDSAWKEENVPLEENISHTILPSTIDVTGVNCDGSDSVTSELNMGSGIAKLKKQKKKKKKKHKYDNEDGEQESFKTINGSTSRDLLNYTSDDVEEHGYEKKKKKKRKEKIMLETSLILPSNSVISRYSDSEDSHSKKKKKKHKRSYSLVIDTNSNNVARLYNKVVSVDESKKYLHDDDHSSENDKSIMHSSGSAISRNNSLRAINDSPKKYIKNDVINYTTFSDQKSYYDEGKQKSSYSTFPSAQNCKDGYLSPWKSSDLKSSSNRLGNENEPKRDLSNNFHTSHTKNHRKKDSRENSRFHCDQDNYPSGDECNTIEKKEIASHLWDDPKKRVCSWNGSAKFDTVDYLLNCESNIKSWDGFDKSKQYVADYRNNGEWRQDEWDEEYDKGKDLKRKRVMKEDYDDYDQLKVNSFQALQNYKNQSKDKPENQQFLKNHYTDRHRHKKRKEHSVSRNRFV